MKSRTLTYLAALSLFAGLAYPVLLDAQDSTASVNGRSAVHYRLIDIATLGGANSYGSVSGEGNRILNESGIVSSMADTADADPYPPNCFNFPGCLLAHAFRWQDGIITDLGALPPGVNNSAAGSINSRGWSAGISQNGEIDPLSGSPELRAVLWADGQIIDLGTLGGNESLAEYLNDAGQVIGAAANTTPDPFSFFGFGTQTRAFLWEKGVMRDLGTLGGADAIGSFGGCVNARRGLVAGSSYINSTPNASTNIPTTDPFLWDSGRMTDLGTLGGVYGIAQCANNRGQVIGQSSLAEFPGACLTGEPGCHAFLWERGILTDLGTLGGTFSVPLWLNNAGETVGGATTAGDQAFHATLWTQGQIKDLGTLPGDCVSRANVINSRDQIIGGSFNCDTNISSAVLWDHGLIVDLNTLIPANPNVQLVSGTDINDRGEILVSGVLPNGDAHDFLLVPCQASQPDCVIQASTAPHKATLNGSFSNQGHVTPSQVLAAWRARWAQRYQTQSLRAPAE